MIIEEFCQFPYNENSYQIIIELLEDIKIEEIAKSFKSQFPKTKAVIISSKGTKTKIEIKMLIIGLPDLRRKK